jgi:hypothetical protein
LPGVPIRTAARIRATVELGEVAVEVRASLAGRFDHRPKPCRLGFERLDLAVDAGARILEDRAPLPRVVGGAEALAVALASRLVLEQLTYGGQ